MQVRVIYNICNIIYVITYIWLIIHIVIYWCIIQSLKVKGAFIHVYVNVHIYLYTNIMHEMFCVQRTLRADYDI